MFGGVDSSVAAALLVEQGHEVVGATMKLWGGSSDSGCCSVSDVEDARRVASQIGIDHYVFNFTEEFEEKVVKFYVNSHQNGLTPNPCIECNRHLKFSTFIDRAIRLSPSPSMSSALLEQKCASLWTRRPSQYRFSQKVSLSPSLRLRGEPHKGQNCGKCHS